MPLCEVLLCEILGIFVRYWYLYPELFAHVSKCCLFFALMQHYPLTALQIYQKPKPLKNPPNNSKIVGEMGEVQQCKAFWEDWLLTKELWLQFQHSASFSAAVNLKHSAKSPCDCTDISQ